MRRLLSDPNTPPTNINALELEGYRTSAQVSSDKFNADFHVELLVRTFLQITLSTAKNCGEITKIRNFAVSICYVLVNLPLPAYTHGQVSILLLSSLLCWCTAAATCLLITARTGGACAVPPG